jgi:anti-sigma-K factor RskA
MMDEINHVTDLLPAFALGSLEDQEREQVSHHLEICSSCRVEAQAYMDVTGKLALGVPQIEPPSRVKTELMRKIEVAKPNGDDITELSWWQSLFSSPPRLSLTWGIISMMLIVILAVSNLLLWGQINRLRENQPPGVMRVVNLGGTDYTPQATGLLVISLDGEHGTLVVDNLPSLGEDQQYQLWLIDNGERTDGGVFSVSSEGYGSVWVSSPQPLIGYSSVGITIEPAGGNPGPTGEKVLEGDL